MQAQHCGQTGTLQPEHGSPAGPIVPGSSPADMGHLQPQDATPAQPTPQVSAPAACNHWTRPAAGAAEEAVGPAAEASGEAIPRQHHSQLPEGRAGSGALIGEAAAEAGARAAIVQRRAHNHGVKRGHGVEAPCPGSPSTHRPHKHHAPGRPLPLAPASVGPLSCPVGPFPSCPCHVALRRDLTGSAQPCAHCAMRIRHDCTRCHTWCFSQYAGGLLQICPTLSWAPAKCDHRHFPQPQTQLLCFWTRHAWAMRSLDRVCCTRSHSGESICLTLRLKLQQTEQQLTN